ncbi:glycosyltransferase [Clostridium tagluense]|uniref:glycosyltransferase n=1 Tax=Clostridium tagluense TaxID=360422 RepID=UPI001CF213BF|nr:glycosyltransferase [Clostridium tagluense]MCB2296777.1 glycosyltransferase [Clostridium tagluense]
MSKVSIAMTTYNGEKYLENQLISLLEQTRKADEVIISDDRSNDKTVAILKKFIEENNLQKTWKVQINDINKGYTKNFLDCANMTTGDIIFFCDQDDIWHPEKINKMVSEFENNKNIKAMSCTISIIDSQGNIKNSLFNKIRMGNGKLQKIEFSEQIKNNMSGGLTLAIKRELLDYAIPIILENKLPYDLPMGLLSSATGSYYLIWQPLVYYRVHSENVSTPKFTLKSRIKNVEHHISGRKLRIKLMKACAQVLDGKLSEKDKKHLYKVIGSLENDVINLEKRKVIPLFFAIFSFNPMINRLIAVVNLICAIFGDYSKLKI